MKFKTGRDDRLSERVLMEDRENSASPWPRFIGLGDGDGKGEAGFVSVNDRATVVKCMISTIQCRLVYPALDSNQHGDLVLMILPSFGPAFQRHIYRWGDCRKFGKARDGALSCFGLSSTGFTIDITVGNGLHPQCSTPKWCAQFRNVSDAPRTSEKCNVRRRSLW